MIIILRGKINVIRESENITNQPSESVLGN